MTTLMQHSCDNATWERRGSKIALAMVAATAAVAGTLLTATAGGASVSLLREGGPPLSLAAVARVGGVAARASGSTQRAKLIAMAEAAVGRLVHHISAEEHHVQKSRGRRLGRRGLHVAHAPQLATAAPDDMVVVGGHQYVKSQMLSAIDSFFDSVCDPHKRTHMLSHGPAGYIAHAHMRVLNHTCVCSRTLKRCEHTNEHAICLACLRRQAQHTETHAHTHTHTHSHTHTHKQTHT